MSRPPKTYIESTTEEQPSDAAVIEYMPAQHADLLAMQEELVRRAYGSELVEGDFGATLADAAAVLAHILSVYQDQYANEAFISTAQSARSLVWHGRRLGYEPDSGVASTGYLVVEAKEDVSGIVESGLPLSSTALGEQKAEHYETIADLAIDASYNAMMPRDAVTSIDVDWEAATVKVDGVGLELETDDVAVLADGDVSCAYAIASAVERGAHTEVELAGASLDVPAGSAKADSLRFFAAPRQSFRCWGWNLPSDEFPLAPDRVDMVDQFEEATWLTPAFDGELAGMPMVEVTNQSLHAMWVESAGAVDASYTYDTQVSALTDVTITEENSETVFAMESDTVAVSTALTARVTAVHLDEDGPSQSKGASWLADWRVRQALVGQEPNSQPLFGGGGGDLSSQEAAPIGEVALDRYLPNLAPGRKVYLSTLDAGVEALAELTRVDHEGDTDSLYTVVELRLLETSDPGHEWTLGDMRINANVVAVSHGKSTEQVLGGSDGVTPFLDLVLQKKPLTYLPSEAGAEAQLQVTVGGVEWSQVGDFHASGSEDLHFRLERDADGQTHVVFGDGRHGAIPPAGRKHIRAEYRHGLGAAGNVAARRITRVKKSHLLVEGVFNPFSVRGGTEPAAAEDVRHRATRYLETFDRAVSVEDHARLALLFPGVARAQARWGEIGSSRREGIIVVVATADGQTPASIDELRLYLDARRNAQVLLELRGPQAVPISIGLEVLVDPSFPLDLVKDAVRDALSAERDDDPGLFSFQGRRLGQPAFLSELYQRLERLDGLTHIEVVEFRFADAEESDARVVDELFVEAEEWLWLLPAQLVITQGGGHDE